MSVITSIEPNDVVLGRGNHIHIDGNTQFRQLVHARSTEYWSCQDNFAKDLIARQIVDTVTSRGGRFLRRVRASGAEEQWELANKETVLVKVKQTFRDFSASHRKQQSAAAASKSHSTNTATQNATAAASMSAVGDTAHSFLQTEGEASNTTNHNAMLDQLPRSLSRAAHPSDFLQSRLSSTLPPLPAPDVRELMLLQELRSNQLNRMLSSQVQPQQQMHPSLLQYSALDDLPLRSLLEQASLLRLLPPSAQEASLLIPSERQMSNFLSNRQFHPSSLLSNTPDVSDLYQRLLRQQQQQRELPPRSIPSAASLLNRPAATPLTVYQEALQSLSTSRLLEELAQQPPPQQLEQLLAQERRQVLPSYFQSSMESSIIASADRVPILNHRSTLAPGLAAHLGLGGRAVALERPSEGKDQSPNSERKVAPPEEDSSGSELEGTD
jgi:hypothetical protein